jgi:hypothetical protein
MNVAMQRNQMSLIFRCSWFQHSACHHEFGMELS